MIVERHTYDLSKLDDDAIRSWVVVGCAMGTYLGKQAEPDRYELSPLDGGLSVVLEPAFEVATQREVSARGIACARYAWPIDLMHDLYRITILRPVTLVRLSHLTREGRQSYLSLVAQAEQLRRTTRAQKAGVLLAPEGASLRPIR